VVPLKLPPLRERLEDIADLARHFLRQTEQEGMPSKHLDASALVELKRHDWPGNVRELENLMRRIAVLYSETMIDGRIIVTALSDQDLGVSAPAPEPALPAAGGEETLGQSVERHLRSYFQAHGHRLPAAGLYDRVLQEVERPLIMLSLDATRGNQIKAADLLGLNRNTLRKKLRELDIQPSRSK
jgi:two-component system, NtrC family, nitrogen regulation response regulator GlnG